MSHKPMEALRSDLDGAKAIVPTSSIWEHTKNGHRYRVAGHIILEALDIVYIKYHDVTYPGVELARPLHEWQESVDDLPRYRPAE